MDQPEVILIGFCDRSLAELQFLKSEIGKSCNVLIMDVGRWQYSNAMEVDIAPAEWLLKKRGGENTEEEVAAMSEETHSDIVAKNAEEWLKAMLDKFHGVIALGGGGTSETALCSRIMREAVPVECPKLLIPVQARDGNAEHATGTDMVIMYSASPVVGRNETSERSLRNAAAAITAMAAVERERRSEK